MNPPSDAARYVYLKSGTEKARGPHLLYKVYIYDIRINCTFVIRLRFCAWVPEPPNKPTRGTGREFFTSFRSADCVKNSTGSGPDLQYQAGIWYFQGFFYNYFDNVHMPQFVAIIRGFQGLDCPQ